MRDLRRHSTPHLHARRRVLGTCNLQLCASHSTHPLSTASFSTLIHSARFLLLQGSATGAYSAFSSGVVPSFVLMAIKGSKVVTYVYELRDGEVNVSKSEFIKQKHK